MFRSLFVLLSQVLQIFRAKPDFQTECPGFSAILPGAPCQSSPHLVLVRAVHN